MIIIPQGAILNCYLPKKKGSLKRAVMNIEANLIQKSEGFEKLLNHTAVIEQTHSSVLIWEATVNRGVAPTELSRYAQDVVLIITHNTIRGNIEGLAFIKSQSGVKYDVKSWFVYLRYLVSGKWTGKTSFEEYSKKWYCSEIVDAGYKLSDTPYKSTPNHIYSYTKHNEIWSGTYADLVYGLKNQTIKIK